MVDIASWLTTLGLALAYRRYSMDYVDEEDWARTHHLGVWGVSSRHPGSGESKRAP